MRTLALALILACCALPAAADAGVSKPRFARTYKGTVSGKLVTAGDGQTLSIGWKVSGLVFRRTSVRGFEGGWTAIYKVAAGKVSVEVAGSDSDCSWSGDSSFSLASALPRPNPSAPFALDKDPLGHYSILGVLDPNRRVTASELCTSDSPDAPAGDLKQFDVPNLLDTGEKSWRPGKRIRGSFSRADSGSGVSDRRSWAWNLAPVR